MRKTDRAAIILAPGFEEIEAVAIIDVLRRGGVDLAVVAMTGETEVCGAHGLTVLAESALDDLRGADLSLLVLPGGMPGSRNLAECAAVLALLRDVQGRGGIVAAICAAPLALQRAGLLAGRRMTCYPTFKEQFPEARYVAEDVVVDGNMVTASGPGSALRFSLALLETLGHAEVAADLAKGMLIHPA